MFAFAASIFIVSLGAMLRFVFHGTDTEGGLSIHTGGVVLMLAGIIGLLVSVQFWNRKAPPDLGSETGPDDPVSTFERRAQLMSEPRRD